MTAHAPIPRPTPERVAQAIAQADPDTRRSVKRRLTKFLERRGVDVDVAARPKDEPKPAEEPAEARRTA